MKRLIAKIFLGILLLCSTEVHQLLKIPYIFKHFAQHQLENSELSFVNFLDMHYMHGSPHDSDYDEDMKLPFKSPDNCQVNQSFVFILPSTNLFMVKPEEPSQLPLATYQDRFIVRGHYSGVWQPPKSC